MGFFTTSQSGNWSDSATWGGAGVPAYGDAVRVQNPVIVDVNTTVGADGSSDFQLFGPSVGGRTGSLTVAAGKTLTVRCGFSASSDAPLILSAGSSLVFDATTNANPAALYQFQGQLLANGTSGAHAVVTSAGGASTGYFDVGVLDVTYCDFSLLFVAKADPSGSGSIVRVINCVFDGITNGFDLDAACAATAIVHLESTKFINGSFFALKDGTPVPMTTGERTITECRFDAIGLASPQDFTITNNYFKGGFAGVSTHHAKWAVFSGNFADMNVAAGPCSSAGDVTDIWFFRRSRR